MKKRIFAVLLLTAMLEKDYRYMAIKYKYITCKINKGEIYVKVY